MYIGSLIKIKFILEESPRVSVLWFIIGMSYYEWNELNIGFELYKYCYEYIQYLRWKVYSLFYHRFILFFIQLWSVCIGLWQIAASDVYLLIHCRWDIFKFYFTP